LALVLHALLAASMVLGLGVVLLGAFAFIKGSHPHQTAQTSVKILGVAEMTTGGSLGLVALGIVLIVIGPLLWDRVPSDVSEPSPRAPPAQSSGPPIAPPAIPAPASPAPAANEPQPGPAGAHTIDPDQATQIGVWESVASRKDATVRAYNSLDLAMANWESKVVTEAGRAELARSVRDAAANLVSASLGLEEIRKEYPQLQDLAAVLPNSPAERVRKAAEDFATAVTQDGSETEEARAVRLRRFSGTLRAEMQAMANWFTEAGRTAGLRVRDLSGAK
jgi:hypothetical protein